MHTDKQLIFFLIILDVFVLDKYKINYNQISTHVPFKSLKRWLKNDPLLYSISLMY